MGNLYQLDSNQRIFIVFKIQETSSEGEEERKQKTTNLL